MKEYNENQEDEDLKVQAKNVENRYGKNIRGEYKVSNTVIMATIIIGIFLIPLQLFFQGVMKHIEDPWII